MLERIRRNKFTLPAAFYDFTDFMGILQQAVKLKLGAFDLKLIQLDI